MSTALTAPLAAEIERVLIGGDLAKLTPEQRVQYYKQVCESVGLNPMTKPFDYLNLNGKTVLYANRNCSDQLRSIKGVSIFKVDEQEIDGLYIVTVYAQTKDGRQDADKGAVNIANLKGESRANAILKAVTKAKRRVTLSICGLGWLDETEVETIPGAYRVVDTGEGLEPVPSKEAQDAYLKGRLEDIHKKNSGVPAAVREFADIDPEPTQATVAADLPGIEQVQGLRPIELRHAATVAEADAQLKDAKPTKRVRGSISFAALKKWKELKDELRALTGTDTIYYSALKAKGYEHSDEIKTEADATAIWKVLGAERNRLKKNAELIATLEQSCEIIGQRAFSDVLFEHSCNGLEDVLALESEPLQALLTRLKTCVDDRKGKA